MNLGILSVVTYHFQTIGVRPTGLTYVSVSIALVTFCGIIASRIVIRVKKLSLFKKVSEKMKSKEKEEAFLEVEGSIENQKSRQLVTSQDLVMTNDANFHLELREPLLED